MNLSEIVRYIYYVHALGMMNHWDEAVFLTMTVPELTSDGFRIVATSAPRYWVGMKEFKHTIFVIVHEPYSNFASMAMDQDKARAIYNQMLDVLTAPVPSRIEDCCLEDDTFDAFDVAGDVEEEDEDDPFDYEGERIANEFEGSSPLATMSCCGAPRPSMLDDDEPCPNCGAI